MFTSYFDDLLNSITNYLHYAEITPVYIRSILSNIPCETRKCPETAEIIRQYVCFCSNTSLKYQLLKAKTELLLKSLSTTFLCEMNSFCLGKADLILIRNFCKSTSRMICDEIRQPPICFELGNECLELSKEIEKCLDAQTALCCAITRLFVETERIALQNEELLRLNYTEDFLNTALNRFSADSSLIPDVKMNGSDEELYHLQEQNEYELAVSHSEYRSDYACAYSESYSYSSFSEEPGKSSQSVHIKKHIAVHKHKAYPSAEKNRPATVKGRAVGHSDSTKVPRVNASFAEKEPSAHKSAFCKTPEPDKVKFSAVAPAKCKSGDSLAVSIYMYTDEFRSVVDDAIKNINGSSVEKTNGYAEAERNSTVRVELSCKEFDFDDNVLELKWIGMHLGFDFFADIPKSFTGEAINFSAKVFINGMLATRLCFTVNTQDENIQMPEVKRNDVKSIFISYASQDRYIVATMVYAFRLAMPHTRIFFDVDSIRSGENWEEKLEKEVKNHDTLYLFWSEYAKASEWVEKEWKCALETHGVDSIVPVPLDHPDDCPPPDRLNQMHFRDSMLFTIKSLKETKAFRDPKLFIVKNATTKYMETNELMIGTNAGESHIIIDDKKISGVLSTIIRNGNDYYISKTNNQAHIKINGTELIEDGLIPLKDRSIITVEGEEMIFYANTLPSKSTKTA